MKTLNYISVIMSCILSQQTLAHGTRGGGEGVIDQNGNFHLRDLVDPSICNNKSGVELRKENPRIDWVLNKISKLDWYFASALRYEINSLNFCFTKELIRLRAKDWESVIAFEPRPKKMAAIRMLGTTKVFVDSDIYENFSDNTEGEKEYHQAFLVVHEALHSFIPYHVALRNESLRAAVQTLEKVAAEKVISPQILKKELANNQVNFPFVSQSLAPQKTAIEFALSSLEDQKTQILNTLDLNSLFDLDYSRIETLIARTHRDVLSRSSAARLGDILEQSGSDYSVLEKILNSNDQIHAFDPLLVAFSKDQVLDNPAYQELIMRSLAMRKGLKIFENMKTKDLSIKESRIVGSEGFNHLGVTENNLSQAAALSIIPITLSNKSRAPAELQGFINFLVVQAGRGQLGWDVIRALVVNNENFYQAFSVKDLQKKLENMNSPVAREKSYLLQALPELINGLQAVLFHEVQEHVGIEAAQKLDAEIKWDLLK